MPKEPKVKHDVALNAILEHGEELIDIINSSKQLPARSSQFYKNVSKTLEEKWKPQDIYRNLREDRNNLRTQIFEKLNITLPKEEKQLIDDQYDFNSDDQQEFLYCDESLELNENDEDFCLKNITFSENENTFQLIISSKDYEKMKPSIKVYNGHENLVLEPWVWSDIINDRFFALYNLPCAYSFKKATVSRNPCSNFITIIGKCKSKLCNNVFHAIAEEEPYPGCDLILKVKTLDTAGHRDHEPVKRQLRNRKRQEIGEKLLLEGAANMRRKLAEKELPLGTVNSATVYNLPVLRKLKQETENKKLGLTSNDSKDIIKTLLKLKYTPPYAGSIKLVCIQDFFLIYILPEQIAVLKEYTRVNKDCSQLSFDSTGSLVKPLQFYDFMPPTGHIFLHEIVINFNKLKVPVGQMLSAAQDTATIMFFLTKFLKAGAPIPKIVVSDYSKAVLNAVSMAFNNIFIKEYVGKCFSALKDENANRPAKTFIRVDVPHFIAIVCRIKAFNKENTAVKDFLVRCVALLVSCNNVAKFGEILGLILVVSLHKYDGKIKGTNISTPAETAREKLQALIAEEEHEIITLIPDENSSEFETLSLKLNISGLDDANNKTYIFKQDYEYHPNIVSWISQLVKESEANKDIEGSFVNGYRLPAFRTKLIQLAYEFPLWSGVMASSFRSDKIRANSSASEGEFKELKNNILRNPSGRLSIPKFFVIHFQSITGMVNLAFSNMINKCNSKEVSKNVKSTSPSFKNEKKEFDTKDLEMEDFSCFDNEIFKNENEECADEDLVIENYDCLSNANFKNENEEFVDKDFGTEDSNYSNDEVIDDEKENIDSAFELNFVENWRGKAQKENPILSKEIKDSSSEKAEHYNKKLVDSELKFLEKWNNETAVIKNKKSNDSMKLKQKTQKKRTKFFKPYPQINKVDPKNVNAKTTGDSKLNLFLENGNNFPKPLSIENTNIILKNTCGPDSILTILATSAIDHHVYQKKIEESQNETFKFIVNFLKSGAKAPIYIQRYYLLKDFKETCPEEEDTPILDRNLFESNSPVQHRRVINLYSNVVNMWKHLMKSEPSIQKIATCKAGHQQTIQISSLTVNHNIILNEGFQKLESAINWPTNTKGVCSLQTCNNEYQENIFLNSHLFIELDIRKIVYLSEERFNALPVTCKLLDFPQYMSFANEEFRLTGIIAYLPGHYIAYCQRTEGSKWEMYNDLWKNKEVLTFNKVKRHTINPAAALYVKVQEKNK